VIAWRVRGGNLLKGVVRAALWIGFDSKFLSNIEQSDLSGFGRLMA
jgi:hypothetical protein